MQVDQSHWYSQLVPVVKSQSRRHKRCGFDPWRRAWQPTPVFLPRESNGQRKLVGSEELDMTEET